MKNIASFALIALTLATPLATFAASINPGPSCVALSRNLTTGSSGSDVSDLQRFLVAQNYPGGGSWMVTGYYGLATQVSVRNFQLLAGLSQTGSVDNATRSAIQNYSCGSAYNYGNTYYNPYNYTYTYPYDSYTYYGQGIVLGASTGSTYSPYTYNYCTYYNCASQSIYLSYLVPTAGGTGTDVTVYGSGFSEDNNTVHFGTGIVPFVRSSNGGTVLSFRVPTTLSGYGSTQNVYNQAYDVYVTNAYGQNSNRLTYTVTGSGTNSGNGPTLSGVNGPSSLGTNESGTWSVSVYGASNATVTVNVVWGDEYQSGASGVSQQSIFLGNSGTGSLSFTHAYKQSGTYTPSFIASNSSGSNSVSRTVTVGSGSSYGSVYLNSLSPSSAQTGTQVVLIGSGFTTNDNTIHFGVGGVRNVSSISNGTVLYFTVPHYVSSCDTVVGSCNSTPTQVTTGTYPVYVTNGNGTTQTLYFTVTN